MHRSIRWVGVLLALALVASGCGKGKEIGGENDLTDPKGGDGALGRITSTIKPAVTTTPPPTAPPTTVKKPAVTPNTTTAPQAARTININDDSKGQSFDPNSTSVYVNSIVRFSNLDSRPHTIEGRRKEFVSPPIPPGAFWDYKANVVGQIELVDQERPYAIGYLNVVGRS